MKKILITGNLGYVAPALISQLRSSHPSTILVGLDTGFFEHHVTEQDVYKKYIVDEQITQDVRNFDYSLLSDIDTIVHLAAISNDPMGESFSKVTTDINYTASIRLAIAAKKAGVRKFVFASSCSVYGAADDSGFVTEDSTLNPVTTYAKSKIDLENALKKLADDTFLIRCLRFATACGASQRLRLDLVLNDFVFSALKNKKIKILSDGSPWRPLIDTQDMARALRWAVEPQTGMPYFLAINAGSNDNNYQIKDLAHIVKETIGGISVELNKDASPDKRSYKVNFENYSRLAPKYLPQTTIQQSVLQLTSVVERMLTTNQSTVIESYKRLNILNELMDNKKINEQLFWNNNI